jgi:predicted  nucleic acid-binding Zn-ribbon protein
LTLEVDMSNGSSGNGSVGLRPVTALPALTRIAYRYCASFVARTLERFPNLDSGIPALEQAKTRAAQLERDLRAANEEQARTRRTLEDTLEAAEAVQAEFGTLRAVASHHRAFDRQVAVRQGALQTIFAASELAAEELTVLRRSVGVHQLRLGAMLEEEAERYETAIAGLRAENERLNTELALMTREVSESESRTAREIEKLKAEIARLRAALPPENIS